MPTAQQLRSDTELIVDQAFADLGIVWRDIDTPTELEAALRDVLPALIDAYGAAAATIAANWYEDLRDEQGVSGNFTAIPAEIPDAGAHALIGWAASSAADVAALRTLIEGGTQRRIANFGRSTVMGSSVADPRARGWQRVSRGRCTTGFCDMLAARGAVYSESSADFAAHDHCLCVAVPAFTGQPRPVKPYVPSLRTATDADRARSRAWIAEHL